MLFQRMSIVLFTIFTLCSCTTSPISAPPTSTYIGPSDALLIAPCRATPAGESLIDLAKAQNKNVSCISMWQKQMDAIKKNRDKQKELYNVR